MHATGFDENISEAYLRFLEFYTLIYQHDLSYSVHLCKVFEKFLQENRMNTNIMHTMI